MLSRILLAVAFFATSAYSQKLLLTNDDGWAVAQIRAQFDALTTAGFDVILSAPAENESGTGSKSSTPQKLNTTCEFDTCPTGSPAEGFDVTNPLLNYVNGFPVDSVRYGIKTLAPELFGSAPDLVVSGPNVGNNLGTVVENSGTVGAACEAALEGLPSIAFSGQSTSQVSFTTLTSSPNSADTLAAKLYSELTTTIVQTVLNSGAQPLLPNNVTINVNYPSASSCPNVSDYSFIFTRLVQDSSAVDVETCGTDHLPDESTVLSEGCFVTISVIGALTKADVNAATQGQVLQALGGLVSCLPS